MRLVSCYIEGFGKLNNMEIQFDDGLNTFVRNNGWGKSTFAAFIRVMLYGFDGEAKRNDIENERRRFRPWSGAAYGGELVFESGKRLYRVQRSFGSKKSEDRCVIYDEATHSVTERYTDRFGEELFHVDSASFMRSMYIGQDDCRTWATDGISAKLGNISESTDDISNYEKARQMLKNLINSQSPSKRTGELYKRKMELESMRGQVRTLKEIDSRIREVSSSIREIEAHNGEIIRSDRRKESKASEELLQPNTVKGRSGLITAGLCLLTAAIVCLVLWKIMQGSFDSDRAMTVLLISGGICAVSAVCFMISGVRSMLMSGRNNADSMNYAMLSDDEDMVNNDVESDIETYRAENIKLGEYTRELAELRLRRQDISRIPASIMDTKNALDEDMHRYELMVKTYELLGEARDTFAARHSVPVMEAFAGYYECVTGKSGCDMQPAPDMTLRYREQGMYRDSHTLSSGMADVLGVCMRAAMVDSMYQNEKPIFIMDDPFVNLDDTNFAGAKRLVEKISKKYQILYFTCSQNRVL